MARKLDFDQGEYKEAVAYFRQKINLPTKKWNDLEGAMHTRAFTVAGCMREDILSDFRNAVDAAIANGDSLENFRDRFNKIASKWRAADSDFDAKMNKAGYAAWRSKVIYQTNMLTAAAAAQERQAKDPDLKGVFTHAKYVCMMLPTSREQHQSWNGVVLPIEHPWWDKHSPPNGFGCLCEKEFISSYEIQHGIERETKSPSDDPNDTSNIGKNWDYSIGEADQGVYWASERAENKQKMELDDAGWREVPQKELWMPQKKDASSLPAITDSKFEPDETITRTNAKEKLKNLLGIAEGNFIQVPFIDSRTGFQYNTNVDVDWLVDHVTDKGALRYTGLPMFVETLRNPSDIRVRFMKSLKTGRSAIRTVFCNHFRFNGKDYYTKVVVNSELASEFKIWTAIASNKKDYKLSGVPIFTKL